MFLKWHLIEAFNFAFPIFVVPIPVEFVSKECPSIELELNECRIFVESASHQLRALARRIGHVIGVLANTDV